MGAFTRRASARAASATLAAVVVTGAGLGLAAPAMAADDTDDVTVNGGAARLDGDQTQALRDAIIDGPAKNVILLIGDGMGDSEITVARNYAEGAGGEFAGIDALPLTGSYTTYSVTSDGQVDYASESASTASAWSTGTKAVDGTLSVDVNGTPQATLLELAKANGLKTGNVSTAEIEDATPGAEVAHISKRSCYGPVKTSESCASEATENGGLGSIAEQLLNVRADVTLGGGAATFNETAVGGQWAGQTLFEQAESRGYQLVDDADSLAALTTADQSQPVLGLFTDGNFPVRYTGPAATVGGGDLEAESCTENPDRLDSGLSLASLTSKAIELLDNEDGFFLQVEGASIDKQDHAANACGQIGETVDLDEAVQVALEFAKTNGDTLVVVSADHAHTSQIVGGSTPGLSVNLLTEEGQSMIVAYGTAAEGSSQQHTGAQVRVAAYGPGAANVVGLIDQTDLFFISANTLELNRDLASLSSGATIAGSKAQVAPGEQFTVTADGLAADWQTTAVTSVGTDLGVADVIDGSVTYALTAPTEPGTFEVTVTGAQTDTARTVSLTVTDTPAATGTDATPAAIAGGSSSTGSLAMTGTTIAGGVLAAAVLAIIAGVLFARHRRRPAGE